MPTFKLTTETKSWDLQVEYNDKSGLYRCLRQILIFVNTSFKDMLNLFLQITNKKRQSAHVAWDVTSWDWITKYIFINQY